MTKGRKTKGRRTKGRMDKRSNGQKAEWTKGRMDKRFEITNHTAHILKALDQLSNFTEETNFLSNQVPEIYGMEI